MATKANLEHQPPVTSPSSHWVEPSGWNKTATRVAAFFKLVGWGLLTLTTPSLWNRTLREKTETAFYELRNGWTVEEGFMKVYHQLGLEDPEYLDLVSPPSQQENPYANGRLVFD